MNASSRVVLYGENSHECGYCKSGNPTSSLSYGMTSSSMKVTEYEALMLRGWRRSGTYFYKPLMHKTCCPMYTIRLNVNNFQPSKSQKKVLKKASQAAANEKFQPVQEHNHDANDNITLETEPSSFTDEKFNLYKKYQVAVHQDKPEEVTKEGFTRFLVESPLIERVTASNQYGSFHQLYRLKGALIAVGVVDLLPSGLSSVYCFYDPDHRSLVLGKYTALKEIEYCKKHGFEYYYMGYYIHDCEKMKYKAEYAPSELLCPSTLTWQYVSEAISLLRAFKFTPLDPIKARERAALGERASEAQLEAFLPVLFDKKDILKLSIHSKTQGDFKFSQLTKASQASLTPILAKWLKWAGSDMALNMDLEFA